MPDTTGYEIVVGLEVHAQLLTETKLFCGDTTVFGAGPNTQVSAISLGHPGTLPMMNREAIALAVRLGLACHCSIVSHNYFARKNYFYPDLPKGYQISQHTTPICRKGYLDVAAGKETRRIRINRIHMEEDAGKSVHDAGGSWTRLDFNRAGMPLLEIVTEPDIRSAEEAFAYVSALRRLVRHLGVCDGNMEQGSLRCDVNISVRRTGDTQLGTKVEIKNLNSIRFIKKAIAFESERLIGMHRRGETILQETRGFDETTGSTYPIRIKEDEDDYRYFPEPDLPPFFISEETIETIRQSLPPLPAEVKESLMKEQGLSAYDAGLLADDSELCALFRQLVASSVPAKPAANWLLGPVRNHLLAEGLGWEETGLSLSSLARLIVLIEEGQISYGIAVQNVFPVLLQQPGISVDDFIREQGLMMQSGSEAIDALVDQALSRHSGKITEYRKGKKGLLSLFVGEVMKLSKGRADARLVTEKIMEKLNAE